MLRVRSIFVSSKFHLVHCSWWVALFVVVLAQPVLAATTVVVGTDLSKTVMKGTLVTPDQMIDGELVIEGDTITCAAVTCEAPVGGT